MKTNIKKKKSETTQTYSKIILIRVILVNKDRDEHSNNMRKIEMSRIDLEHIFNWEEFHDVCVYWIRQ